MLLKFDNMWLNTAQVVAIKPAYKLGESIVELVTSVVTVSGTPDEVVHKLKEYDANCR